VGGETREQNILEIFLPPWPDRHGDIFKLKLDIRECCLNTHSTERIHCDYVAPLGSNDIIKYELN